jgi:HAD superfamily hydrolase (TIGR01490 family)
MRLALFDLDNTLLSGDSDFAWAQFLIAKGVLDRQTQEAANRRFLADYESGALDIDAFLAFQLSPLARHPRAMLDAWHAEFMTDVIRPMISADARALVQKHVAADTLLALVTATNSFVTAPIARELAIPHLIATIPACEHGQFTGQVRGIPAFRAGKVTRVQAWLEAQALTWAHFAESRFYSDSHNDLPLLESVTTPVAVNPDPHLRAVAKARRWEILQLCPGNAPKIPV